MADVTERGQIILITGFALAVTLVAVVLLLNTVIYTENISTRDTNSGPGETLQFRDVSQDGLGKIIVATNHEEYDDFGAVHANLTDAVANLTKMIRRNRIGSGTVAVLNNTTLSTTGGVLLQQTTASRQFTSGGTSPGAEDWELATDVDSTRRVKLVVERATLVDEDLVDIADDDGFGVRLEGASNNWTAYIYKNHAGNIELATNTTSGSLTAHCDVDADKATVALTGEGLVGADCGGYEWAETISSNYSIWFLNGDDATGTYNLTVKGPAPQVDSNFNDSNGADPQALEAIYSATITLEYETATITYITEIRVAPGEDDA